MGAGCEPGIGSSPPLKGSATTDSYWYSLTALHNSGHSRVARLCMHIYTVGMHKHAYNRRRTSTSDRDLAPGTLLVMRNPRGEAPGWPRGGMDASMANTICTPRRPGVALDPNPKKSPDLSRTSPRLCGVVLHEGGESRIIREHVPAPSRGKKASEPVLFSLVVTPR